MLVKPLLGDTDCDTMYLLGRLSAAVAHDLNNHLAVVSVLVQLAQEEPDDPDLLVQVGAALERARRLVTTLGTYARGESPPFQPVPLGSVVRTTLAFLSPLIPPNITVRAEIAADVPPVRGAEAELEQLVMNLALNAADAMPDGGTLAVRVRSPGAELVYLEVCDEGPGIPAAALLTSDIGRTVSSKPGRRSGLGLGIVRRVVSRHDGSLTIARRGDRSGTIVSIFLPAC